MEIAVGRKFNRLRVVRKITPVRCRSDRVHFTWECVCRCGKTKEVRGNHLLKGLVQSCGCLQKETMARNGKGTRTHGKTGSVEHRAWIAIKQRCCDQNSESWNNYGGRGIKICDRWMSFDNFIKDMGMRPSPKHSINRKDNNGDYTPCNCEWAVAKVQQRNKRTNRLITYKGVTRCIAEWAEVTGLHKVTIKLRLDRGWSTQRTLTTPSMRSGRGGI